MRQGLITLEGTEIPFYSVNTLIVGSGAAALNAAVQLVERGQQDLVITTSQWGGGTSNNAGSDKQTYYKLSLSGDVPDSAFQMAKDLYGGGCMHGDIALCEAQNSAQVFFRLVELGVPFPHGRYGAYVGYKTDHDPLGRGTSAGPLTSHLMFEALAREVQNKGIPVLDEHEIIALLTAERRNEKHVVGALALDRNNLHSAHHGLVVFNAVNVVLGTGGPAGIYKTSVYPESQTGSHGLGFAAGAVAQNLTESQYGLASIKFKWNLSGTYQQVIPRYISTNQEGGDEREFLNDFFPDMGRLASAIFLKGYQWPFDPRKVTGYGSSLIDLLVYRETVLQGRRVFLDFRHNPSGAGRLENFSFDLLSKEAYEYLEKSKALFGTPIQRLQRINQPAIDLYASQGIDIGRDSLEIAVCAQHNNGGFRGTIWWESSLKHLFPVGEVNGTHGVYRPGGSALNSGQVGGLRAALFIAKRYAEEPPEVERFLNSAEEQIRKTLDITRRMMDPVQKDDSFLHQAEAEIQERMTGCGAHIRDPEKVKAAVSEAWALYSRLRREMKISSARLLPKAFKTLDLCLTHAVYLEAIQEYLDKGGRSRGSYLVLDPRGVKPCSELGDEWCFSLAEEKSFVERKILEVWLDADQRLQKQWVDIRPIPQQERWFETLWNDYLNDRIIQ